MDLVQYSDSESDENPQTKAQPVTTPVRLLKRQQTDSGNNNNKKKKGDGRSGNSVLPPLPAEFLDLYATNSRVSVQDDPSLHDGRKRIIPHVVGNWPTHIYLEWYPAAPEVSTLEDIISRSGHKLQNGLEIHSLLFSDLGAQMPLHISLSRPVALVTDDRQPFIDMLNDAIRDSDIRPFRVSAAGLDWVSNFERTRWFLVLRVVKPALNELNCLLLISNQSVAAFHQPPLYQSPDSANTPGRRRYSKKPGAQPATSDPVEDFSDYFHISIAWSLTEPSVEDKQRVASVELGKLKEIEILFHSVKVKIGNRVHNLELPTLILDENGFCGL
ncbi:hypothetical protein GX48_01639 [Paracoccidioides brasiliensis]|nr:hypothetical protein GX48_01639 [Paracoccidioides brasiliensis]